MMDQFAARTMGRVARPRRDKYGHAAYMPPRMDDRMRQALEVGRVRLLVAGVALLMVFGVVSGRVTQLAMIGDAGDRIAVATSNPELRQHPRADIVDRKGELLATDLATASLYANARRLLDPEEAARGLVTALPVLDYVETLKKLSSKRTFVWLRRDLTPREQWEVNRLGIPGLDFVHEYSRVYPHGPLMSHVLGYVDSDNRGIAGIEKRFDDHLGRDREQLQLTIDLRIQHIVREELRRAMIEFRAKGASGLVLDARSGEVVSLVSLPDFDPNHPGKAHDEALFNRASLGVYELGSTFKVFTTAIALDAGVATMNQNYDATRPLRVASFTIRDFHGKKRWLSLPEVFIYSSNVGAARMAMDIGGEVQQDYLRRLGLLDPAPIELPEVGRPLVPSPWQPVSTMTIGFGHGLAVSPLQLASGVSAVVNGGLLNEPSLVAAVHRDRVAPPRRVFQEDTSLQLRRLMRFAVRQGTGKNAEVKGYPVGGKTGTAEKPGRSGYRDKAVIASFVAAFPIDDPRYVVLAVLDEPNGNKKTRGYATGGWVAAPVVRTIIERMAPMVGLQPHDADTPELKQLDMEAEGRKLASY